MKSAPFTLTSAERLEKNRALFDTADNEIWHLTVYDAVHQGWRFTNIGGSQALRQIGARARLTQASEVLELCCGLGDTCCYLATHFHCRVTGMDINARQLARARANLAVRHSSIHRQVRFILCDILRWQPEQDFDLLFTMDSLMYVPERECVLAQAARALRPGGMLALTEVLAGPNLNARACRFMRDKEGVVSLPKAREQAKMLEDAGFEQVTMCELTPLAVRCFETICCATLEHRETLIELEGARLYQERREDNQAYRDFFRDGTLVYFQTFARMPAG
jgi:SAM-dependent methyltransferase